MPGMQGARACTGQSPAGTGAPGRPRILLLTYALATLELTCLFMQFSILPVSASSPGPCHQPAISSPICATAGTRAGGLMLLRPLSLGAPCHTGAETQGLCLLTPHQHIMDPGGPTSLAALGRGREKLPHHHAALLRVLALFPRPGTCSAHVLAAPGPLLRPTLWQTFLDSCLAPRPTSPPSLVPVGPSSCGVPTAHILFHGPGREGGDPLHPILCCLALGGSWSSGRCDFQLSAHPPAVQSPRVLLFVRP